MRSRDTKHVPAGCHWSQDGGKTGVYTLAVQQLASFPRGIGGIDLCQNRMASMASLGAKSVQLQHRAGSGPDESTPRGKIECGDGYSNIGDIDAGNMTLSNKLVSPARGRQSGFR